MNKKTVRDVDIKGKRILMRADFNVPLADGRVSDDFRLRATLPTIKYLREQEARLVLCSHLGRPGGKVVESLRLDAVAERLGELLNQEVQKIDTTSGQQAQQAVGALAAGEILLLENTRFHPGEKTNQAEFAQALAQLGELFVNDAFAAAHRAHASTYGVAEHLPAVAGLLMAKEIETLSQLRADPQTPLVMILGGAKISDKIDLLETFLERVDAILVGGGIANTFLKVKGVPVGASLVDNDSLEQAGQILARAGDKVVLPPDVVAAARQEVHAEHRLILLELEQVPAEWMILDIGPRTRTVFQERLVKAKTVLWNGPLGMFELGPFAHGTLALVRAVAHLPAKVITGGGETAAAVQQAGLVDAIEHVSTGGGAFLSFMAGQELPGISVLADQ